MTTYPSPSDSVNALMRPDGSSAPHSEDHGRIIGTPVNAKRYLKGDNTTESEAALSELEAAAVNHHVVWPKGIYALPRTFNVTGPQAHHGAGNHANGTAISCTGYVFTLATGVSSVTIEDMYLFPNAGTTVGGAVKVPGTNPGIHNTLEFNRLVGDGANAVTTLTTPMFYLENIIGCHVWNVRAAGAPIGIWAMPGDGYANSNSFRRLSCSGHGTQSFSGYPAGTGAVIGSAATSVRDSIFEGCAGYGLVFPNSYGTVQDCWFEGNSDTHLVIPDGSGGVMVLANKFHYQVVGNPAAVDISIGNADNNILIGNIFQDGSNSRVTVDIASGSSNNLLIQNHNLGTTVDLGSFYYVDAGADTLLLSNSDDGLGTLQWGAAQLLTGFGSGQPGIRLGNNLATDYVNSPAGQVYLYSRVSGGKTHLCARFPSGGVVTIASEP